jgi:hypothetical protein
VADSTGDRPAQSGRRRAGTIILILFWLILILGPGTLLIVGSVLEHGDAARTSYTQAHGARRAARVISEDAGTGNDPTSALAVRLSEPVNGHDTTTVHIQGAPTYSPGAPVTVVVDLQDPGYAELPGAPYTTSVEFWTFLVVGLGCILVFPFGLGLAVLQQLRSRRRLRGFLLR